jgi:hypothetical protein
MNGKLVGIIILGSAAIVGAAIWYLQVYGFYERADLGDDMIAVELTSLITGQPEPIIAEDFEAIDATSSPIRYRACFTTPLTQAELSETYQPYPEAKPLVTPGWFDCFDSDEVDMALEQGRARAFMGQQNIYYGIDRVVAIMDDGRGFVWQLINACGKEVFDGNPPPPGCPEPDNGPGDGPGNGPGNGPAGEPQEGESDG